MYFYKNPAADSPRQPHKRAPRPDDIFISINGIFCQMRIMCDRITCRMEKRKKLNFDQFLCLADLRSIVDLGGDSSKNRGTMPDESGGVSFLRTGRNVRLDEPNVW